jgi:hypothetical protein
MMMVIEFYGREFQLHDEEIVSFRLQTRSKTAVPGQIQVDPASIIQTSMKFPRQSSAARNKGTKDSSAIPTLAARSGTTVT